MLAAGTAVTPARHAVAVAVTRRLAVDQPALAHGNWRRFDETGRDVDDFGARPFAGEYRLLAQDREEIADAVGCCQQVHGPPSFMLRGPPASAPFNLAAC